MYTDGIFNLNVSNKGHMDLFGEFLKTKIISSFHFKQLNPLQIILYET